MNMGILARSSQSDTICDLIDHCLKLMIENEDAVILKLNYLEKNLDGGQEIKDSTNLIKHFAEKDETEVHIENEQL